MDQFSTAANHIQIVQKKKSNVSPHKNSFQSTPSSFNRNILRKAGILISQLGVLILMFTVFNFMATYSTLQMNQEQELVEKEFLYADTFKLGLLILVIGGIVFITGFQKLNYSFINNEKDMLLKKFNALNFKKAFGF